MLMVQTFKNNNVGQDYNFMLMVQTFANNNEGQDYSPCVDGANVYKQ